MDTVLPLLFPDLLENKVVRSMNTRLSSPGWHAVAALAIAIIFGAAAAYYSGTFIPSLTPKLMSLGTRILAGGGVAAVAFMTTYVALRYIFGYKDFGFIKDFKFDDFPEGDDKSDISTNTAFCFVRYCLDSDNLKEIVEAIGRGDEKTLKQCLATILKEGVELGGVWQAPFALVGECDGISPETSALHTYNEFDKIGESFEGFFKSKQYLLVTFLAKGSGKNQTFSLVRLDEKYALLFDSHKKRLWVVDAQAAEDHLTNCTLDGKKLTEEQEIYFYSNPDDD